MTRIWISWWQPSNDYRPVKWPMPDWCLGYWCSGSRDDAWSMVAWIEAENERVAEQRIKKYWPEATEWRFCETVENDWRPTDRFPRPKWLTGPAANVWDQGEDN